MALKAILAATLIIGGVALCACGHDQDLTRASVPSGFGLHYNDQGSTAALAYGRANSDDVALMLQCRKGSGRVQVSDVVRDVPVSRLVLKSSGKRSELAVKLDPGMSDGPRVLTGETGAGDAALAAFRKSGRISVSFGETRYGLAAREQEHAGVERFFKACERA